MMHSQYQNTIVGSSPDKSPLSGSAGGGCEGLLPHSSSENILNVENSLIPSVGGVPYLDSINTAWGGYPSPVDENKEEEDLSFGDSASVKHKYVPSVDGEEVRCSLCGKILSHLVGRQSGKSYYKLKTCFRWFCPDCGKVRREFAKTGRLHRRRCNNLKERLGSLENVALRQYVFPLPDHLRQQFFSRDAILSFKRMCYKIVKKLHPDKPIIAYFHAFGDKQEGYNPHWNFHVVESRGTLLKIDNIDLVKSMFKKALIGYGCRFEHDLTVHYSFANVTGKILHRLRYMCRPHPNSKDVPYIKSHPDLWEFFLVTMKGFYNITTYGDFGEHSISDTGETKEELEGVCGESLRYDRHGTITVGQFRMMFQACERVELSDGFYRIDEYHVDRPAKYRRIPHPDVSELQQLALFASHGIVEEDLPF